MRVKATAMRMRNPFLQTLIMIVAAAAIAVVANGFASRERRLVLPGFYPNALRVPPRMPVTNTGGAAGFSPPVITTDTTTTTTTTGGLKPAAPQVVVGAKGEA